MKNHMTIFWFLRFDAAESFRIRFDNVKVYIRVYNGTRYLILYGPGKNDAIYDKNKYLISQKKGVQCAFYFNCARIKIALCDSLPIERILTLFNVMNSLSQFLIKIKITTTIIYHWKKCLYHLAEK